LTWPIFNESHKEEIVQTLQKFLKDLDSPIDKEKYLKIQAELGQEPDFSRMPLGFEDIPQEAQVALNIYNTLGNRIYPDVGFTGKDYTNLPILIDIYEIYNKKLLLELLTVIEAYYIDKNQKQIKKMYDDMKKKK
jgi:hypothetical protein